MCLSISILLVAVYFCLRYFFSFFVITKFAHAFRLFAPPKLTCIHNTIAKLASGNYLLFVAISLVYCLPVCHFWTNQILVFPSPSSVAASASTVHTVRASQIFLPFICNNSLNILFLFLGWRSHATITIEPEHCHQAFEYT